MTTAEPGSRAGARAGSPAGDRAVGPVRLERLVEAGPAVAYARDPRPPHRVTFVSANVERIFGLTVEELITASTPFGGRLHPDDERTVADHWDRLLREGAAVSEYRLRRPGGGLYWIRDEQSLVRDADGRTVEIVGSLLDVTEQKRTEERAERLQELTAGLAAALTPEHVAASALLPALSMLEAQGVALILREDDGDTPTLSVRGRGRLPEPGGAAVAAAAAGRRHPGRVCGAGRHAGVRRLDGRGAGALPGDVPGALDAQPARLGGGAAAGRRRR